MIAYRSVANQEVIRQVAFEDTVDLKPDSIGRAGEIKTIIGKPECICAATVVVIFAISIGVKDG